MMSRPIARCAFCKRLFWLETSCPDCFPKPLIDMSEMTPWKHIGWADEYMLLTWDEVAL